MEDLKFGSSLTFPPIHEYAVSPDGKAATITLGALEAKAEDRKTDPVVTRVFSMVIPVTNGSPPKAAFKFQGAAVTTEGGQATLLVIINGQSAIFSFPNNSDESYLHTVNFSAPTAVEIRLTVVLIAELDKQFPGAAAQLNLQSIDADAALARELKTMAIEQDRKDFAREFEALKAKYGEAFSDFKAVQFKHKYELMRKL